MKIALTIFLSLIINTIYSQKNSTDTISITSKNKYKIEELYNDLKQKYNYTLEYLKTDNDLTQFNCDYITKYNYDSLVIKEIPVFKIKKNINLKKNILTQIDFKNTNTFIYNIYTTKEYITTAFFFKSSYNEIIGYNCEPLNPLDSNIMTMMKLKLQEKYYIFKIEEFSNLLFIINNGIVHVITEPKLNGDYKKTEINQFFRENYKSKKTIDKSLYYSEKYFFSIKQSN
ncbi:hypothetical protein [Flavobacterium facile]|uniref:hypothetical protein n=1 Tax=Flavobacterium facile TaxID=2893174 RepID=UPI002E76D0C7|nr:hypothetical protein [Flavobacterium sp. T-12]